MNKQIADILTQPAFDRLKDWHDIGPVQKATLELFAELIVRECAGIYSKIDNGNSHMGTDNYLDALHKTFWS
jgi:hypothetical protein